MVKSLCVNSSRSILVGAQKWNHFVLILQLALYAWSHFLELFPGQFTWANSFVYIAVSCVRECMLNSRMFPYCWTLGLFSVFGYNRQFSISSVQFSSVAQSCPTLGDPMNRSTPGLSVHHQLPEFTQIRVHRVRDAIQPSHPRSSLSPTAPNLSQHQSLFQ